MSVATRHPDYIAHAREWQLMADSMNGEPAIKGDLTYLPKPAGIQEAEQQAEGDTANYLYKGYVARAQYPEWVRDGVRAMMGLVSRIEPEINLPDQLSHMLNDAAADGFGLKQVFLRACREVLIYGRQPLLVDIDGAGKPFFSLYSATSAINWRESAINGRHDLTLAVFTEHAEKPGDEFGHETEKHYRVLDINEGQYRIRVMDDAGKAIDEPRVTTGTGDPLPFIPVVFAGSTDNAPDVDEVPLLTMARSALKYYQVSADYFDALHHTSHPQPYVTGMHDGDSLRVTGPNAAWLLPQEATCGYLEFTGAGINANRNEMTEQKNAALEAGARAMDVGGQESGDARLARQDDQRATLNTVVMTVAEAIEQCLKYAALWVGADQSECTFSVKPDFSAGGVDQRVLAQLQQAAMAGGISWDAWWHYARTGKLPDREYSDEQAHIENPDAQDVPA